MITTKEKPVAVTQKIIKEESILLQEINKSQKMTAR